MSREELGGRDGLCKALRDGHDTAGAHIQCRRRWEPGDCQTRWESCHGGRSRDVQQLEEEREGSSQQTEAEVEWPASMQRSSGRSAALCSQATASSARKHAIQNNRAVRLRATWSFFVDGELVNETEALGDVAIEGVGHSTGPSGRHEGKPQAATGQVGQPPHPTDH